MEAIILGVEQGCVSASVPVSVSVYPASPGPCSLVLSSGLFAECSRGERKMASP